jgi:hypothetical protein
MGSGEEFSALYYLYATPRSVDKIKKALLIFDHSYFIIPAHAEDYFGLRIEGERSDGGFTVLHWSLR